MIVRFPLYRGYNIGTRLIEDFLSRTSLPRCADFREVAEVISKVWSLSFSLSPHATRSRQVPNLRSLICSQVGFKSFLNITPTITFPPPQPPPQASTSTSIPASTQTSSGSTEFILTFDENPLAEFVELPPDALGQPGEQTKTKEKKRNYWNWGEIGGQEEGLWFSNIYCGVIRGCLEMVSNARGPA